MFSPLLAGDAPKSGNASFTGTTAGVAAAVDGTPNEKFDGSETWTEGLDRVIDLAKKLGTAEEPFPVTLASNCSAADCFGEELNVAGAGLGGVSAICGAAVKRGVNGAGADTGCESAATVTGGDGWGASTLFLKLLGRMLDSAFSVAFSDSLAASLVAAAPKAAAVPEPEEVVDLINENGSAAIGGSLAFVESWLIGAV